MSFTVLIPAYDAGKYIIETLSHIPKKYKIVIGVDGCKKTLDLLLSHRRRFPNMEIIYSKTNNGTYVMRNTMLEYTEGNVLFFDADDIPLPKLFQNIENNTKYDALYWRYDYLKGDTVVKMEKEGEFAKGVFYVKESVIDTLGGFKPWKCSADSEFVARLASTKHIIGVVNEPLMLYRVHDNSLSSTVDIKFRKQMRSQIKFNGYSEEELYVERVISNDIEFYETK